MPMTAKAALPHAIHGYGETDRPPLASPDSSPTAVSPPTLGSLPRTPGTVVIIGGYPGGADSGEGVP